MKLVFAFTLLAVVFIAGSWAAPQAVVEIVSEENEALADGKWKFGYTLNDGTKRSEQGTVVDPGTENEAISVTGSFSWTAPDNQVYTIDFVADKEGFRPTGAHLPK